jgi:hypothetical protein
MNRKIYIVVEVTFDYYRFHQNLFASTSITEINQYLHSEEFKQFKNYPVYWTDTESFDEDKSDNHIWIQEF